MLGASVCGRMLADVSVSRYVVATVLSYVAVGGAAVVPGSRVVESSIVGSSVTGHSMIVSAVMVVSVLRSAFSDRVVCNGCSMKTMVLVTGLDDRSARSRSVYNPSLSLGSAIGITKVFTSAIAHRNNVRINSLIATITEFDREAAQKR